MIPLLTRRFVLLTGIVALAAYVSVYARHGADDPIRSDGYSYYVYLPSWIIHGDTSLDSVARVCCGDRYPDFTAITRVPETGRWLNPHPIGEAILLLPFFLAALALTLWSNLLPDGFSLYFQHAAGLGGLVYMLAGLAVLRRLLRRHFADGVTLATLVTITFGTNLFHYGVYDSVFSHAFSFFLIAALLDLTDRWWTAPRWTTTAGLGVVAALVILTRHANAVFLPIVPLYGVTDVRTLTARAQSLWARRSQVAAAAAIAVAGVLPQLAIYRSVTGHWMASPYGRVGQFTFASPHLFGVLFSVQKGLFFWSPALLFAVAGMFTSGWPRRFLIGAALALAADAYLIASWWDWQLGGSFGHRGFTDALAIFAVFLAAFFVWASQTAARRAIVSALITIAVLVSVAQMTQYWLHILPMADTTWEQYRDVFLHFS